MLTVAIKCCRDRNSAADIVIASVDGRSSSAAAVYRVGGDGGYRRRR